MALIPCRECTKEISDSAKDCPQCGAAQRSYMNQKAGWGLKLTIVAVILVSLGVLGNISQRSGPSPDSAGGQVVASLRDKQAECRRNLAEEVALGAPRVTESDGYAVAEFTGWNWSQLDHDDKIRQGLLVFCAKMPASGHYSVLIKDRQSGKQLGSVVDGNYFD